jgi:hypothetical protein
MAITCKKKTVEGKYCKADRNHHGQHGAETAYLMPLVVAAQ